MYLSLYSNDEELHGEAQDVSRVKAMPNSQKEECGHMRKGLISQELQPFEDISLKKKRERNFLTINLDKGSQKSLIHQLSLPDGRHLLTWKLLLHSN